VIVVTAKAQTIDRVLGLHIAKVDDYISKPFSPQEIINSVEKVLARRQKSSEESG
jgi:DNA-binding response OmpR family regulator